MRSKSFIVAVTIAGLAAVLLAGLAGRLRHPHYAEPYNFDESDYVRALSYGALANYLGSRERSGVDFLRASLREYQATGEIHTSKYDVAAGDAAGLRHYHPPSALYPAAVLAGRGILNEELLRLVPIGTGLLVCLAAGLLACSVLPDRHLTQQCVTLIIAAALVAASAYQVLMSTELSFHAAYSLVSVLVLTALVYARNDTSGRWWAVACALLGCAALTMEYWFLLVPPAAYVMWRQALGSRPRAIRWLVGGILSFVAACSIVWPPFLWHASFLQGASISAWMLVHPLPASGLAHNWVARTAGEHMMLVALLVLAGFCLLGSDRMRRSAAPILIYVVGFLLLNLRVAHMKPLYAAHIIPPLAAIAAVGVALAVRAISCRFAQPVAAMCAVAFCVLSVAAVPITDAANWRASIVELRGRTAGKTVLVTPRFVAAAYRYYLPDARVVADSEDAVDRRDIAVKLQQQHFDYVLIASGRHDAAPVDYALPGSYARVGTFRIEPTFIHLLKRESPSIR